MIVYAATLDFFPYIVKLFKPKAEVKLLPNNLDEINGKIDLLIFSGGEDIYPELYGGTPTKYYPYNRERDSRELEIMTRILEGKLKVNKVVGICRGLQMINVALGGTLVSDIGTHYGTPHANIHKLKHVMVSRFSGMSLVNSMHHQCANTIGRLIIPLIIAKHTKDNSPEIILWGDAMLGVQFHPEFLPTKRKERTLFVDVVMDWVEGKASIVEPKMKWDDRYGNLKYTINTNTTFETAVDNTTTVMEGLASSWVNIETEEHEEEEEE